MEKQADTVRTSYKVDGWHDKGKIVPYLSPQVNFVRDSHEQEPFLGCRVPYSQQVRLFCDLSYRAVDIFHRYLARHLIVIQVDRASQQRTLVFRVHEVNSS